MRRRWIGLGLMLWSNVAVGMPRAEIVVPNTILIGEVMDEDGKPVPGAFVQVDTLGPWNRQRSSRVETDAEGKFRVRSLPPGPAGVEAEAGGQTSGWISAVIPDEGESPWLRLVVRARREVQGRVFSTGGAVPGARIEGFPDPGSVGIATGVEATSEASGHFSFGLPAGARAVHLRVQAPGFAFRIFKVSADSGRTLRIPLETRAGILILDRAREKEGVPPAPAPLLFHGGSFVPVELLRSWVRSQKAPWPEQGPLVIPGMEAGEYALCSGGEAVAAALAGAEPPASACSRGVLAPYGELLLKAPGTRQADQ